MIKSHTNKILIARKFDFLVACLLVCFIAFPNYSNTILTIDIASEKTEQFVDGENENKELENYDKSAKDFLISKAYNTVKNSNIINICNSPDITKQTNLYVKIPTPPPDIA